MPAVDAVTDLIAANLEIAAPIVALVGAWLLYGVLGKQFLDADDDFWPVLRNRVLPLLDRAGATSGLYATHQQTQREFVGVVAMDEEQFERELEAAGFYRNPLASVKRSPHGWTSDGSWARRYGRLRALGAVLRSIEIPIAGVLGRTLGRFLQASGDVFAKRQLHVTLYTRATDDGARVWLYAHDEPNSLNPLTAWRHYVGQSWSAEVGVAKMEQVLEERGIEIVEGPRE